ncbi:MAG: leucine-rich repeat domain-containing protein [Clostridia bacterium]|nr:leucine-rich repeat domain-containing protein [Clostridia bacterium]
MKRIVLRITVICFLLLILMPFSAPAEAQSNNSCGENLTWELDEESGVLTITGTGTMPKYVTDPMNRIFDTPPWWYRRELIRSVVFEDGTTEIGENAFYGCENMTDLRLPDTLEAIRTSAFEGCASLREVKFPGGLKSIYPHAFEGCTGLESVEFPDGIETVNGFRGCTGLTGVTVPDSVTTLGEYCFRDCENLVSASLGRGIAKISGSVFRDCVSLRYVSIPDTVEKIEPFAFSGCTSLDDVYYEGTYAQWQSIDISFSSRLVGVPEDVNDAMGTARIHYDIYEPGSWAQYDRCDAIKIWDSSLSAETYVYAESKAEAFSVSYDADGRPLEIKRHALTAGEINHVSFDIPEDAVTVKVFVLGEASAPLCPAAFVTSLVE